MPSNEPDYVQDFFGRRQLRINNGQDPEKFTPLEDQRMKWPIDEEQGLAPPPGSAFSPEDGCYL